MDLYLNKPTTFMGDNRPDFIKEVKKERPDILDPLTLTGQDVLSGTYKIHVMPQLNKNGVSENNVWLLTDKDEAKMMFQDILILLKNPEFLKHISTFKFATSFSSPASKRDIIPVFIFYPMWGKEHAQAVVDFLCKGVRHKELKKQFERVLPRYNVHVDKINYPHVSYLMGDGDDRSNNYTWVPLAYDLKKNNGAFYHENLIKKTVEELMLKSPQ